MIRAVLLASCFGAIALGGARAADNPLLAGNRLAYDAPPFDRIHDSDYAPAFAAALRAQRLEIERIAGDRAAPSFANTVVALERSGAALTRLTQIFENIVQANTDPALDTIKDDVDPKLQAQQDATYLNARLFARVRAVHGAHPRLDPASAFLLERTYKNFLHAGAGLAAADQTKLRDLNQQITRLQTEFQQKLLAATAAGAVVVDRPEQLAGLDAAAIASAAEAAKQRGQGGKYLLPLSNTTQQPILAKLADRGLRARIMAASEQRGDGPGPNDVRALVGQLAHLRAEKAALLGFASFAAYTLDLQMAATPAAAYKLLDSLVPGAMAKARGEAADMQAIIDKQKGGFTLAASDWQFYSEQVRARKYALDEAQLRPYFEVNRVLQDGVFFAAHQLYGLTFKERHNIPVYQPDVRVFEIFDAGGQPIALWYADYFARANKQGGAWCDDFVPPSGLLNRRPVVVNVASFAKPAAGQPALISFEDVTTMFHEFGHALHTIFSNQHYPSQNGFSVPTDMVEFPSQFNEHWALDPIVLSHYARDWRSNAAMPADLADKIRRARTFNQGYELSEYLGAALLDLEWHGLAADAPVQAPDAFEAASLRKHGLDFAPVPPRYRTTYFSHIWAGGYAANYYAYLWAEVLDDDAFAWFGEHGGLSRANGQRFRDMMLATGYTADPMELFRNFRGRAPESKALLVQRGLAPQG